MVNYKCPRCGFNTNIKTKYIQHLKRKFICEPTISENSLREEYIKYNLSNKIINNEIPQNKSKMNPSESKMNPNESKMNPNESKNEYKCKFCEKLYTTNSNLNKHLKICKEKAKDEEEKSNLLNLVNMLNEQLEKRDKQIDEQNKQITELIKKAGIQNSNITNNIQNNIKILAYKNTDISHLTDKDYLYCLNRSNMVIPNLIKKIHFNPKKPENHNIYISNIKNKYIMTYDGEKWNVSNQNETIDDMIDSNEIVIEQKLEEWLENGKEYPDIMKKFNRYLEKKEKDQVKNAIKEEIKLMLFNNRKMIVIP